MDLALLRRVERTGAIVGGILALAAVPSLGPSVSAAWAAGVTWSLLNLRAITVLIRSTITPDRPAKRRVVRIVLVKFPLLYGAGAALMLWSGLPIAWLTAGFTWPFFVLFMKGAGRAWLRLDQAGNAQGARY